MIILVGMAGTGKSTQGQRIASDLNCEWLSVGNILRANMDGKYAKQMMAGEIISDKQVLPLLDKEFKRIGRDKEFILDGSPRTMSQAKWLVKKIHNKEVTLTAVIHLNTSEEVARQRLIARGRPDDYDEAIKERFKEYKKVIVPILDFLEEEKFPVFHIDAERAPEEIATEIEEILNKAKD